MIQYIDKSAVIAEIEKRIKKYATIDVGDSGELEALYGAKCHALKSILTFIDTLETKQNSWNNAKDIKAPSNKDILAWYRKNDGVLEGSPKVVWFCSDEESAKETELAYWLECPDEEFDKTYWFEKQEQVKETAISQHENKTCKENDDSLTYKGKPKFQEGDWIVKKNIVYHIDKISGIYLTLSTLDGTALVYHKSVLDSDKIHLWTIADTKDGDVLACESGWTCIFKALNSDNISFSSYCFMDSTGWFCEIGSECHTLDKAFVKAYNGEIYPATKTQRNLLFSKMKEKGYEWNAEAKKLNKKLEAFPILSNSLKTGKKWTEEDEKNWRGIIDEIEANKSNAPDYDIETYDRFLSWLDNIKQRLEQ